MEAHGPVKYDRSLLRRLGRPGQPCEICRGTLHPRVREHCYTHQWIRGILRNYCNGLMMAVDRGATPCPAHLRADVDAYIEHWNKCPDCHQIGWTETAYCACEHADPPKMTYDCTEPPSTPPCPWIGTGFRPAPPAS
jgi:hypothetical protein